MFSCSNQDQELDRVDFGNLRARLRQNGVQEKLTRLWIDRCSGIWDCADRSRIAALSPNNLISQIIVCSTFPAQCFVEPRIVHHDAELPRRSN